MREDYILGFPSTYRTGAQQGQLVWHSYNSMLMSNSRPENRFS